jgi:pilus assembly protein Flp/PilA
MVSHHPFSEEEGQSLVEYALIIVLIAIVVIVVVTLFGSTLKDTYCSVVYQVVPGSDVSQACSKPIVIPMLLGQGGGQINVEARIHDPDGDPDNPYTAITHVEFYIDSTDSGPVQTEYAYPYCLGSNTSGNPCLNYSTGSLSSGPHTVIILAYDADGNMGRSRYRFTK